MAGSIAGVNRFQIVKSAGAVEDLEQRAGEPTVGIEIRAAIQCELSIRFSPEQEEVARWGDSCS